jgi:hypothetical protein
LIFDWGDACISHPFLSLRVALQSVAERLGPADDAQGEGLRRMLIAYLEPWRRFAPMAQLFQAYEESKPLAILTRVLTWDVALMHANAEERDRDADFIVKLLRALLELEDAQAS